LILSKTYQTIGLSHCYVVYLIKIKNGTFLNVTVLNKAQIIHSGSVRNSIKNDMLKTTTVHFKYCRQVSLATY